MLYTSNLKGKITIMTAGASEVSIAPGAGMMDDAQWEQIADYPTVVDLIEKRLLEINEPPASPATKPAAKAKAE